MCCSGYYNTQNKEESCKDDTSPTTDLVNEKAEEEHPKDLANEVSI